MSSFARRADLSEQTQSLLAVIHGEATLGCLQPAKSSCPVPTVQQLVDNSTEDAPVIKRSRYDSLPETLDDMSEPTWSASNEAGSSCEQATPSTARASLTFHTNDTELSGSSVTNPYSLFPMFYYCPYRRRLKNVNVPK